MPHPTLNKLRVHYANGSAWTPGDFNDFQYASQRFQDFFGATHDLDGYHVRDELIPREAVIATYAAGAWTPQVWTAGISAIVRTAGGHGRIEFDPDFPTGTIPMLAVFPVVNSTDRVYAYQDGAATNDETALSFAMFDAAAIAFADRDFLAVIYAPKR